MVMFLHLKKIINVKKWLPKEWTNSLLINIPGGTVVDGEQLN